MPGNFKPQVYLAYLRLQAQQDRLLKAQKQPDTKTRKPESKMNFSRYKHNVLAQSRPKHFKKQTTNHGGKKIQTGNRTKLEFLLRPNPEHEQLLRRMLQN